MACGEKRNLSVCRGQTASFSVRPGTGQYTYKAISGVSNTAPCVVTVVGHGIPDGYPVAVVTMIGMDELEASGNPPVEADYREASVADANSIVLNGVNSTDYTPYISGGYVQFHTPRDLATDEAAFTIYTDEGGTAVLSLTSDPAAGVVVDNAAKVVTATIADEQSAALRAGEFFYRFNLLTVDGEVLPLTYGMFTAEG